MTLTATLDFYRDLPEPSPVKGALPVVNETLRKGVAGFDLDEANGVLDVRFTPESWAAADQTFLDPRTAVPGVVVCDLDNNRPAGHLPPPTRTSWFFRFLCAARGPADNTVRFFRKGV